MTTFYKYQGTGNDFVMIDNRQLFFSKNDTKLIKLLCDRRFGIGADGLILLENHPTADFTMVYYNSDGNPSSMCGNGGRGIVAFAKELGVIENEATFKAVDGMHEAKIVDDIVYLKMQDVPEISEFTDHLFLNTGSPHHVQFASDLKTLDVKTAGAALRYGDLYGAEGSNINFVEIEDEQVNIRTYERGVEDETLSCGTGATAVAIAMHHLEKVKSNTVNLTVPGGNLQVNFEKNGKGYKNVYLIGPAQKVFTGEWL